MSSHTPWRTWGETIWTGIKVFCAVLLFGRAFYDTLIHVVRATVPDGIEWTVGAFLYALIPLMMLHGGVVLVRSRGFPLGRRLLSSLLTGVVSAPLLYGLAVALGALGDRWDMVAGSIQILGAIAIPGGITVVADGLLDPARRWRLQK